MLLYMICGKQNNDLMSYYIYSAWKDSSQDSIIYIEQGDYATGRSRCRSINRTIKKLAAGSIIDTIIHRGQTSNVSKIHNDMVGDILSQGISSRNIGDFFGAVDDRIRTIIFKTIQKHVHIKTLDPFTGKIGYEEIDLFMSKDVQRLLK